jgi:hypothetical protein
MDRLGPPPAQAGISASDDDPRDRSSSRATRRSLCRLTGSLAPTGGRSVPANADCRVGRAAIVSILASDRRIDPADHPSTAPTRTARSTVLPLRQAREQRPQGARCLRELAHRPPRASGRPGRCIIEATVNRKAPRGCSGSPPGRPTDPRGGCLACRPAVIWGPQRALRAIASGQPQPRDHPMPA